MSPNWLFNLLTKCAVNRCPLLTGISVPRFRRRRQVASGPSGLRLLGWTLALVCLCDLSSAQAQIINSAPSPAIPPDVPNDLFQATAAPLVTSITSEANYEPTPGLIQSGSIQPGSIQPGLSQPGLIESTSDTFIAQPQALLASPYQVPPQQPSQSQLQDQTQLVSAPAVPSSRVSQEPMGNPFVAAPVIVGLPTSYVDTNNQMVVHPKIQWGAPVESNSPEMDVRWLQIHRPSMDAAGGTPVFYVQEPVIPPEPSPLDSMVLGPESTAPPVPMFESIVANTPEVPRTRARHWLDHSWWNCCPGDGLGQERLPFALVDIDPAQPFNNFRIRMQAVHRWKLPDRAEYLWQRTVDRLGPPQGESYMDYQQANLRMETGSKKFSTAFDVPLRATNPEVNRNHAGLGDMRLIVKTVLIEGEQWMITQYFGSSFPTGSATMGLGRGKVALEPGLLIRNRMNDRTWNHNEIKFWFPLGGDPQHSGQVLKVASGFNRVFWESDRAALIPSLEFSSYAVLNGLARDANGTIFPIDGDTMLYITPGLHYALDRKGDFGLLELSTGLSQAVTRQQFYGTSWTFDIRWSW